MKCFRPAAMLTKSQDKILCATTLTWIQGRLAFLTCDTGNLKYRVIQHFKRYKTCPYPTFYAVQGDSSPLKCAVFLTPCEWKLRARFAQCSSYSNIVMSLLNSSHLKKNNCIHLRLVDSLTTPYVSNIEAKQFSAGWEYALSVSLSKSPHLLPNPLTSKTTTGKDRCPPLTREEVNSQIFLQSIRSL